jgi:hypothetical protein
MIHLNADEFFLHPSFDLLSLEKKLTNKEFVEDKSIMTDEMDESIEESV